MVWMDLRLYVALLNWRRDVISELILRLRARRIKGFVLSKWAIRRHYWVDMLRDPPPKQPQPVPRTSASSGYVVKLATAAVLKLLSQCVGTWAWYTKILKFAKKVYLAEIRNAWITWTYFMLKEKQLASHTASRFYQLQLSSVADDWLNSLQNPPRIMEFTEPPPSPPPRAVTTSEMLFSLGAPVGSKLPGGRQEITPGNGRGQSSQDESPSDDLESFLRTMKLESYASRLRQEFGIESRRDLVRLHDDRITLFRLTKLRIEAGDQRKLIRLAHQLKSND
jgi:hypothetical protein